MSVDADIVVVGAGVIGSATAYHLANRGTSVLLVEQVNALLPLSILTARFLFIQRINSQEWETSSSNQLGRCRRDCTRCMCPIISVPFMQHTYEISPLPPCVAH